jgi:hypothetical protein
LQISQIGSSILTPSKKTVCAQIITSWPWNSKKSNFCSTVLQW